jgi:hypothetical protein
VWFCLVEVIRFVASIPRLTFLGLRISFGSRSVAWLVLLLIVLGRMKTACFRISDCCFLFSNQCCATRGALVVAGWWRVVRSIACYVLAVLLRVRFEQVAPKQL